MRALDVLRPGVAVAVARQWRSGARVRRQCRIPARKPETYTRRYFGRITQGSAMSRPATLGELRASGWVSRPIKEELRANAVARARQRRAARRRRDRLRRHRHPAARERAARRPRHRVPRRAGPGQDADHARARRPARRVDADRRRAARSTTTRTTRSRRTPAISSTSAATRRRSTGCTAIAASARSSRRPTPRSPT